MSEEVVVSNYKPVVLPEGYVPMKPKLSNYEAEQGRKYPRAFCEDYKLYVKWRSIQIAGLSGGSVARAIEGKK